MRRLCCAVPAARVPRRSLAREALHSRSGCMCCLSTGLVGGDPQTGDRTRSAADRSRPQVRRPHSGGRADRTLGSKNSCQPGITPARGRQPTVGPHRHPPNRGHSHRIRDSRRPVEPIVCEAPPHHGASRRRPVFERNHSSARSLRARRRHHLPRRRHRPALPRFPALSRAIRTIDRRRSDPPAPRRHLLARSVDVADVHFAVDHARQAHPRRLCKPGEGCTC